MSHDNSDAKLFSAVWYSFPHPPPVDCMPTDGGVSGQQLAVTLQQVLARLDIHQQVRTYINAITVMVSINRSYHSHGISLMPSHLDYEINLCLSFESVSNGSTGSAL